MTPLPIKNNSRLVQTVWVRRGSTQLGEMPTRSLIEKIRGGDLTGTDEFSGDGEHWTRLAQHPQLKPFFQQETPAAEPPGFRHQLEQMANLLDDLNR